MNLTKIEGTFPLQTAKVGPSSSKNTLPAVAKALVKDNKRDLSENSTLESSSIEVQKRVTSVVNSLKLIVVCPFICEVT